MLHTGDGAHDGDTAYRRGAGFGQLAGDSTRPVVVVALAEDDSKRRSDGPCRPAGEAPSEGGQSILISEEEPSQFRMKFPCLR